MASRRVKVGIPLISAVEIVAQIITFVLTVVGIAIILSTFIIRYQSEK